MNVWIALDLPITHSNILYSNFKVTVNTYIQRNWQRQRDSAITNKLHLKTENLGKWTVASHKVQQEEIFLARVGHGHTCIFHPFLPLEGAGIT